MINSTAVVFAVYHLVPHETCMMMSEPAASSAESCCDEDGAEASNRILHPQASTKYDTLL